MIRDSTTRADAYNAWTFFVFFVLFAEILFSSRIGAYNRLFFLQHLSVYMRRIPYWQILRAQMIDKEPQHSLSSLEPCQAFLVAPPGRDLVHVAVLHQHQSSRAARRQGKPSVIVHWRPSLSPVDLYERRTILPQIIPLVELRQKEAMVPPRLVLVIPSTMWRR